MDFFSKNACFIHNNSLRMVIKFFSVNLSILTQKVHKNNSFLSAIIIHLLMLSELLKKNEIFSFSRFVVG